MRHLYEKLKSNFSPHSKSILLQICSHKNLLLCIFSLELKFPESQSLSTYWALNFYFSHILLQFLPCCNFFCNFCQARWRQKSRKGLYLKYKNRQTKKKHGKSIQLRKGATIYARTQTSREISKSRMKKRWTCGKSSTYAPP